MFQTMAQWYGHLVERREKKSLCWERGTKLEREIGNEVFLEPWGLGCCPGGLCAQGEFS